MIERVQSEASQSMATKQWTPSWLFLARGNLPVVVQSIKWFWLNEKHPQRLDSFKSFKSVVEKIPPETARTEDEEGRYL